MLSMQNNKTVTTKLPVNMRLGLRGLESHVDYGTYLYLLRFLYRIVFKSIEMKENKRQLQRRIKKFEAESGLPGFLSAMNIDELLEQLEDAQYFYPIQKNEVSFPTIQ